MLDKSKTAPSQSCDHSASAESEIEPSRRERRAYKHAIQRHRLAGSTLDPDWYTVSEEDAQEAATCALLHGLRGARNAALEKAILKYYDPIEPIERN